MSDILIGQLAETISTQLGKWGKDVEDEVKQAVDDTMKTLVSNTKRDAPVRKTNGGDYRKAISSKVTINKNGEYQKTWYVKPPHHRLAHLLENGHEARDGTWVDARPHIGDNANEAIITFNRRVREAIKNA